MAKQGQHKNDSNDPRVSRGRNKPRESSPMTAGTPKKRATYVKQAREHQDTERPGQQVSPEWRQWHDATPRKLSAEDRRTKAKRSGSDSNASAGSRGH